MPSLINSLSDRWQALRERQHRFRLERIASLSPTVRFSLEGTIENNFGDPKCILIGAHSYLRGRLITYGHGGRIEIGEWCYVGVRSEIWSMNLIQIGNHVGIGHDVNIHDGTGHSLDAGQRAAHVERILTTGHPRSLEELPGVTSAPVIIEDDVSIGFGSIILQGVHIGARSVIAPGSMVTTDVPADVMYMSASRPILIPLSALPRIRSGNVG